MSSGCRSHSSIATCLEGEQVLSRTTGLSRLALRQAGRRGPQGLRQQFRSCFYAASCLPSATSFGLTMLACGGGGGPYCGGLW